MAIEAEIKKPAALGKGPLRLPTAFLSGLIVPLRRFLRHHIFSSLTRRILFLNLAALGVLVIGILYLNQFRDGLIDARVESLMTQGEIIAGAIAASATVETDSISIDPEKLLELQAGESLAPGCDQLDSLDFPINPERVAPVLRRLISPTRTRARIYDRDANLLLDSRHLYSRGQILRYDLPPIEEEEGGVLESVQKFVGEPVPPHRSARLQGAARRQRLGLSRSHERAHRQPGDRRAHQRAGRADRFGRRADPALQGRARRADAVDAGRRHRQDRQRRAPGDPARLRRRRAGHGDPVDAACLDHRQPAAPAGGRRRARPPRRQEPRGDPGFLRPPGRDRQSVGGAAGNDQRALCAHRGDREFRRRRQPRAEEPADLAAQRRRDAAAGQERELEDAADGRDPARRAPARPADHRHFRCLAPRCRAGARRRRQGRHEEVPRRADLGVARHRTRQEEGRDRLQDRQAAARREGLLRVRATTSGSAR